MSQKRKREGTTAEAAAESDDSDMPPEPPALTAFHRGHAVPAGTSLVGSLLTGQVDAKMDCGYFVSVNVNGYVFQGTRWAGA